VAHFFVTFVLMTSTIDNVSVVLQYFQCAEALGLCTFIAAEEIEVKDACLTRIFNYL